ncbi:MAG TPA: TRAM domain-containing protein [Nitrososphaeraceae archaeon]|nr:TRAM domain-containing protein [Nitrososphaeraceae archaeon]
MGFGVLFSCFLAHQDIKQVYHAQDYSEAVITDTSRAGDGIARIQGLVIFVKGAMAWGDKSIKIKITGDGAEVVSD